MTPGAAVDKPEPKYGGREVVPPLRISKPHTGGFKCS